MISRQKRAICVHTHCTHTAGGVHGASWRKHSRSARRSKDRAHRGAFFARLRGRRSPTRRRRALRATRPHLYSYTSSKYFSLYWICKRVGEEAQRGVVGARGGAESQRGAREERRGALPARAPWCVTGAAMGGASHLGGGHGGRRGLGEAASRRTDCQAVPRKRQELIRGERPIVSQPNQGCPLAEPGA